MSRVPRSMLRGTSAHHRERLGEEIPVAEIAGFQRQQQGLVSERLGNRNPRRDRRADFYRLDAECLDDSARSFAAGDDKMGNPSVAAARAISANVCSIRVPARSMPSSS